MRWIVILLILLIVAGTGLYGAGGALPAERAQSAEAVLPQAPEAVWAVVGDMLGHVDWDGPAEEIRKVEGKAGVWQARLADGTLLGLTEIGRTEQKLLAVDVQAEGGDYGAVWVIELRPEPADETQARAEAKAAQALDGAETEAQAAPPAPATTRVTVTEKRIVENPLQRFRAYYLGGGENLPERYLRGLKARLREAQGA